MIDGATRWSAFKDVALPLVLPGIATTAILCLVFSWNDYAFAVTFSGPGQPDAADRRVAARHADVDRLGPAHGDRDDRRRADDPGRADRPQVARDRPHARGGDGRMSATVDGENRAAVLHGPGDVRVEERPVPEPGAREVLVEIAAVGVCGSDVHYYEHGRIGSVRRARADGPRARVVGPRRRRSGRARPSTPSATAWRSSPASRAAAAASAGPAATTSAATSGSSRRRRSTARSRTTSRSTRTSRSRCRTPSPTRPERSWSRCRSASGRARRPSVSAGDRVLVTGAGPIGLLAAQCARAFGATEITVTDVNPHRLEPGASAPGATRTINVADEPLDDSGIEADALIECSGPPGLADGRHRARSARPAPRCWSAWARRRRASCRCR